MAVRKATLQKWLEEQDSFKYTLEDIKVVISNMIAAGTIKESQKEAYLNHWMNNSKYSDIQNSNAIEAPGTGFKPIMFRGHEVVSAPEIQENKPEFFPATNDEDIPEDDIDEEPELNEVRSETFRYEINSNSGAKVKAKLDLTSGNLELKLTVDSLPLLSKGLSMLTDNVKKEYYAYLESQKVNEDLDLFEELDEILSQFSDDPLIVKAAEVSIKQGTVSSVILQKKMRIGVARASRLLEELETAGVVSALDVRGNRNALVKDIKDLTK